MNRKTDLDPFACKPPPSKWLRIAFWSFVAAGLAMLILANHWR